jgi:hypothetical protein
MKTLTSLCQHYTEVAYYNHLNTLDIQALDRRIGTILLALLELIAQRRLYSKQHQDYADHMVATLKRIEGMGSSDEAENLRGARANINNAMQAVWGANLTTTPAIPAYQEVPDQSGQPAMVIPLARPRESKMTSDAVRELGRYLVESPMLVYRALFASEDESEVEDEQESAEA